MSALPKWNPLPEELTPLYKKLQELFDSWRFTPYLEGSCAIQEGVDCVRWICYGIVDQLFGYKRIINAKLPSDACFHSPKHCFAAMKILKESYDPLIRVPYSELQPGDLLVSGPLHGGPGHLMMVGPRPNTIWHTSIICGVTMTGMLPPFGYRFFRAWRFAERSKWLTPLD